MLLLKKYLKWISKNKARRYDLAELLSGIIFVPTMFIGLELLRPKYSVWFTLLILFLIINLYILCDNLFLGILGKFNVKISKWTIVIPWFLVFTYFVLSDF
ncbi:hypothetical protein CN692_12420 [Bacillus sp. AFS002410]|nr:hypothetical protein CN692_12420 [Bacillus sp. AFS002410]